MPTSTINLVEPKLLGFWIRCLRSSLKLSQDALAVAANVDIRTIQRVEAGKPCSVTVRRSLARALGFENPDAFDDPQFAIDLHKFFDEIRHMQDAEVKAQHPDYIRVDVTRATNGDALARVAYEAQAYLCNVHDGLSEEVHETAAALFDYVRDLGDLGDYDVSFSEKRDYAKALDQLRQTLEAQGGVILTGFRGTKISNQSWADKTPVPLTIGYIAVVPPDHDYTQIMAPRSLRPSL